MPFVGREHELRKLQDFYHSRSENFAIVYGRRRVGKSELLRHSLIHGDLPFVFLQCRGTGVQSNLDDLMAQAADAFGVPRMRPTDPETALKTLFELMQNRPAVLVLDEYPYLRDLLPGCDTLLQYLVDSYKTGGLKLVVCGSYLDVMKGMSEYKSPLFGRAALNLHLEPMDYLDSAKFYPGFSNEDKVRLFSVFGGVPYYNAKIDPSQSVRENVIRLLSDKDAVLANEAFYLLRLEISKISNAERVLEAMASGALKFSDILGKTAFSSSPALADTLNRLVAMGFLRKVCPINDQGNRKKTRYAFKDHLMDFYFRFIYRNQSRQAVLTAEHFYQRYINDDFETDYVPRHFERIVQQFLLRESKAGRIDPPILQIGSYWYDIPQERRNGEFDVVTEDDEGWVTYECKFKASPMTQEAVEQEIAQVKASDLPVRRFGFVSRVGFANVRQSPDRRFFTLEDLYRDLGSHERNH